MPVSHATRVFDKRRKITPHFSIRLRLYIRLPQLQGYRTHTKNIPITYPGRAIKMAETGKLLKDNRKSEIWN